LTINREEPSRITQRRFKGVNRGVDPTDVPMEQFYEYKNMTTDVEIGEMRTRNGYLPVTTDIFSDPFAILPGFRGGGGGQIIIYDPPPDESTGTLKLSAFPTEFEVNGGPVNVVLVAHGGAGLAAAPSYSWDFIWDFGGAHGSDQTGASTSTSNNYTVADVGIKYVHVQLVGDDGITYTAWVKLTITAAGATIPDPPLSFDPPPELPPLPPGGTDPGGIDDPVLDPPLIFALANPPQIFAPGDPTQLEFTSAFADNVFFTDPENPGEQSTGKTSGVINANPAALPITYLFRAVGPGGSTNQFPVEVTLGGVAEIPAAIFITGLTPQDPGPDKGFAETTVPFVVTLECRSVGGTVVPFPFAPDIQKVVDSLLETSDVLGVTTNFPIVPSPDGTAGDGDGVATFTGVTFTLPAADQEEIDIRGRVPGIDDSDLSFALATYCVTPLLPVMLMEVVDTSDVDVSSPQDGNITIFGATPELKVNVTLYLKVSALVPPAGPAVDTTFNSDVKIIPSIVSGFPTDLSNVTITYIAQKDAGPWGAGAGAFVMVDNIIPAVAFVSGDQGQAWVEVSVSFDVEEGNPPPAHFLELAFTGEIQP